MTGDWLRELGMGIVRFLLNPLVYWTVLFVIFSGIYRIKKERDDFGTKIFGLFSEWQHTWKTSLIAGVILSAMVLGLGIVLSIETILLLSIMSMLLSIGLRYTYLSPSYTIGFSVILLLFMPFIWENQTLFTDEKLFSETNFTGLAILLGLLLILEATMINRVKESETYPVLHMGKRGKWIGTHHIKKATLIPFFAVIPNGTIESFVHFWPALPLAGDHYSLVLIPFLLGFDISVSGSRVKQACKRMAKLIALLGVLVLVIAVTGYYLAWLSLLGVIIAIIGREYIRYRHRVRDDQHVPYFTDAEKGLKILAIIPGSPAEQLHIVPGEIIYKVNGQRVQQVDDFYRALQASGAFFKLDILDEDGEVRFVQRAFYQGEHYELGLLFVKERYRQIEKQMTTPNTSNS